MFRKIFIITTLVFIAGIYSPVNALEYAMLEPLPGISRDRPSISTYLPQVFNLAIAISAGMAFVMITLGGITYATSDSLTGKSQGKEYIENAVWGLLLVIGAWAILYTINPQMLNFTLSIQKPPAIQGSPTVRPGVPMTSEEVRAHNEVKTRLETGCGGRQCVGVNNNGQACTQGQTTGCTNLNGLPESAIFGLIALKMDSNCNCEVIITGGTEGGHATHGKGAPIVDLRPNPNLDRFIKSTGQQSPTNKDTYFKTINGQRVSFTFEPAGGNPNGTSSGDHWHVVFQ